MSDTKPLESDRLLPEPTEDPEKIKHADKDKDKTKKEDSRKFEMVDLWALCPKYIVNLIHEAEGWLLIFGIASAIALSASWIELTSKYLTDLRFGYCTGMPWLSRALCCGGSAAVDFADNKCKHDAVRIHAGSKMNPIWAFIDDPFFPANLRSWHRLEADLSRGRQGGTQKAVWKSWSLLMGELVGYVITPRWFDTAAGLVAFVFTGTGLAACSAWLVVNIAPYAAGSGIPEAKTLLSGSNIPNFLSPWVLLVKIIGLSLAVASGLCVGKEGPLIHVACCWASFLSSRSKTFGEEDSNRIALISASSAAGVSAAFGAPLGGVLFSLEEVSTYFPKSTLYYAFFCSVVAAMIFKEVNPDLAGHAGLFQTAFFDDTGWQPLEIIPFLFVGVLGGTFGALFIFVSSKLGILRQKWRQLYAARQKTRRIEKMKKRMMKKKLNGGEEEKALLIENMFMTSFADFEYLNSSRARELENTPSTTIGDRTKSSLSPRKILGSVTYENLKKQNSENLKMQNEGTFRKVKNERRSFFEFVSTTMGNPVFEVCVISALCLSLDYFFPMLRASSSFYLSELFGMCNGKKPDAFDPFSFCVKKDRSGVSDGYSLIGDIRLLTPPKYTYSQSKEIYLSLGFAFCVKFLEALICMGLSIPSGVFIPSLLVGATMGRIVGLLLVRLDSKINLFECHGCLNPGAYALVGAISLLGGVTRMTISLAVIAFELTGQLSYVVPFMGSVLAAKWAAELFQKRSVYEANIMIKNYQYVDETELDNDQHLMSTPVEAIVDAPRVTMYADRSYTLGWLRFTLSTHTPPVVIVETSNIEKRFLGSINRKSVISLLKQLTEESDDLEVNVFDESKTRGVDNSLSAHFDRNLVCVESNTTVSHLLKIFKQTGIRYCVCFHRGFVKGIITRKKLLRELLTLIRAAEAPKLDAGKNVPVPEMESGATFRRRNKRSQSIKSPSMK